MPAPIHLIDDTPPESAGYDHDVQRLKFVLREWGYLATERQARKLWELYSDDSTCGWANMTRLTDSQLVQAVTKFLTCHHN